VSRLLVIRLSALGDVIHTIPAVVALRERHEIAWVVEAPYRELVEVVAGVRAIPVSLKRWSAGNILAAWRAVRGFDAAIDFQGLVKSALLARASGARERIGFAREFVREKPAAWLMNRRVMIDPRKHVVEWNLQLAGVEHAPPVDFTKFATNEKRRTTNIVLLPGAGRAEKQWPHFPELARRLGDVALAAWGPGEEELAKATGARLAPRTSLRELAQLLRDAALVIGGDTGPLHLAAALGTPVIGLYGPTNPARNGPYGQLGNVVETYSTTKAMSSIGVDDVMRKIGELKIMSR
jgi:lipopolysaccharide heptosyltransferase I